MDPRGDQPARSRRRARRGVGAKVLVAFAIPAVALSVQSAWGREEPDRTQPPPPPRPETSGPSRSAKEKGPRIYCDKPVHDFGQVWSGTTCKHTFQIMNAGTTPLEITKVKASCGCTLAGKYDRVIPVGGIGRIPVSLKTRRFRGKFAKSITVTSNDPTEPTLTLKLTGAAKPYVDVQPPSANFRALAEDEVKSIVIKLRANIDEPLILTLPEKPDFGPFTADLEEVTPGKEYLLTITARPPYRKHKNRADVILNTNLPKPKQVKVPCIASVPPRLDLSRKFVYLPAKYEKPYTTRIRFTNNGKEPVHVLSAETDVPDVKVEVKEQEEGVRYDITLSVPPNFSPPAAGGKVVLKTDDPKRPTLTVGIRTPTRPMAKRARRPAMELVGRPVPELAVETVGGKTITAESLAGRVTILDFYASWCGHSRRQLPHVEQVWKEYQDKGVNVIGISQDARTGRRRRTPEQVLEHRDRLGLTFDIALDPDKKIGAAFKVKSFPTLFLIGKTGVVEAVHIGSAQKNLADVLRREIETLLAGKTRKDFVNASAALPGTSAGKPPPPAGVEGKTKARAQPPGDTEKTRVLKPPGKSITRIAGGKPRATSRPTNEKNE